MGSVSGPIGGDIRPLSKSIPSVDNAILETLVDKRRRTVEGSVSCVTNMAASIRLSTDIVTKRVWQAFPVN